MADHQKAIEDLNAQHAEALATQTALVEEKQNTIASLEQEKADLQAEIATKQAAVDGAQAAFEQKEADFKAKEDELAAAQTELTGVKESLTTAEQTIAERDQQITDLNAQLTELQNNPGAEPQAGAAPQNNGGGADAPGVAVNQYVYDTSLTREQNIEAEKKWNAEHGK